MDIASARQVSGLKAFRQGFRDCLGAWGDTLFELGDALLTIRGPLSSLPMLSLEPGFRRGHASLYRALSGGSVDQSAFAGLLASASPADWPQVYAVDTSTYPRTDAETSPEREFCHIPGSRIIPGHAFSLISRLSFTRDSWTAPADIRRFHPGRDRRAETAQQVHDVIARLAAGSSPLFVFDAGYSCEGVADAIAGTLAAGLVRLRADARLHRDPPERVAGQMGRPRTHGALLRCADLEALPAPDETLVVADESCGTVTVSAWHGVHPRVARDRSGRITRGSLITVRLDRPRSRRVLPPLRLFWIGPGLPDLDLVWRAYLHRFDIEHTFRFFKRTLGWTVPSLGIPERLERWTAVVVAAYTQLRLAIGLVADRRLPWQRPLLPGQLTPGRVRADFSHVAVTVGSPATAPKVTQPGPGGSKGVTRPRRPRFPVVRRRR